MYPDIINIKNKNIKNYLIQIIIKLTKIKILLYFLTNRYSIIKLCQFPLNI